jgi:hypothetical protein
MRWGLAQRVWRRGIWTSEYEAASYLDKLYISASHLKQVASFDRVGLVDKKRTMPVHPAKKIQDVARETYCQPIRMNNNL